MKYLSSFLLLVALLVGKETLPLPAPTPPYGTLYSAMPCHGNSCIPHGWTGRADASLLVWQAREEGLDFAIHNAPRFSPAAATTDINGRMVGIDFDWMPALKINLGIDFPRKGWDMDLRWTFFYSHSAHTTHVRGNVNGSSIAGLLPIWAVPTAAAFETAHASWQVHVNAVDWELGDALFLTPSLSLRLFAGIKGLSIAQKFHVHYTDGLVVGGATILPFTCRLHNDSRGLGPRVGFSSRWRLPAGWSLMTNLAGDLVLTLFNMKRHDNDQTSSSISTSHSQESFWAYRPVLECMLGGSWDTCYGSSKRYSFGLDLAYELQYFWEQNMLRFLLSPSRYSLPLPSRGDLSLQGVTLNFRFGY